jgi:hypothetical protein
VAGRVWTRIAAQHRGRIRAELLTISRGGVLLRRGHRARRNGAHPRRGSDPRRQQCTARRACRPRGSGPSFPAATRHPSRALPSSGSVSDRPATALVVRPVCRGGLPLRDRRASPLPHMDADKPSQSLRTHRGGSVLCRSPRTLAHLHAHRLIAGAGPIEAASSGITCAG